MHIESVVCRLIASFWVICLTWTIVSPNGQFSPGNHNYTFEGRLNQQTQMVISPRALFSLVFFLSLFSSWVCKTLDMLSPVLNQPHGGDSK